MKIVVCDDDALVYEQMKNIIASSASRHLPVSEPHENLMGVFGGSKDFRWLSTIFSCLRMLVKDGYSMGGYENPTLE